MIFLKRFALLTRKPAVPSYLPLYSRRHFSDLDPNYQGFQTNYFQKRLFLKPYTIQASDVVLSVTPIKGRYGQKKDYYTLQKNGTILLEFIPMLRDSEQKNVLNWQNKKNFALSLKHLGELLKLNEQNMREKEIKIELKYQVASQKERKSLIVSKLPSDAALTFCLSIENDFSNSKHHIRVEPGDFLVFQELCKFSLPYLIGWHAMYSQRVAEEDANSEGPDV